jgi:hypothetical protein
MIATLPDHITIKMLAQQRHLMMGQEYTMPIGVAHGYIERKMAEAVGASKDLYAKFAQKIPKK